MKLPRLTAALLFTAACLTALPARAQDEPENRDEDSIQIDMSVLEELGRPAQSSTASTPRMRPVLTAPAPVTPTSAPAPIKHGVVRFPTENHTRTENADPALPAAGPKKISMPVPDKMPPLPPRRPVIQKASAEFVEQARQAEAPKPAPAPVTVTTSKAVDLVDMLGKPPPGEKRIPMPAVPKAAVDIEPLNDPLARQLKPESKSTMVEKIQTAVRQTEGKTQDEEAASQEPPVASFVPRLPAGEDTRGPREEVYITIPFRAGLDGAMKRDIRELVLAPLKSNPDWKVQIQAFADPAEASGNAKKLSLDRGMAVRQFLLDNGIEPYRIDLRALGAETDRAPLDRVDLLVLAGRKNG